MSSSIALRRSPKPGALTAATLRPPRSLLTTRVRQRLALDILGDDEQRFASLHHRLQNRQHRLQRRQLLLVDEDVRILKLRDHLLGVGDEIGREIAAVELHAFDHVELGLQALGLFDRDHALIADLLHGVRNHLADRLVAVRGDGADLRDLLRRLHLLGALFDVLDDRVDRDVDAALEIHRVHPGGDELEALLHNRGGEHGRGGGAVSGKIVGLRGDLAHHLRTHVLELVRKFDLLGDGHAVLGDARRAVGLVQNDIPALGAQRHLDGVVEGVDPAQHSVAGVGREAYVFSGHELDPSILEKGILF